MYENKVSALYELQNAATAAQHLTRKAADNETASNPRVHHHLRPPTCLFGFQEEACSDFYTYFSLRFKMCAALSAAEFAASSAGRPLLCRIAKSCHINFYRLHTLGGGGLEVGGGGFGSHGTHV